MLPVPCRYRVVVVTFEIVTQNNEDSIIELALLGEVVGNQVDGSRSTSLIFRSRVNSKDFVDCHVAITGRHLHTDIPTGVHNRIISPSLVKHDLCDSVKSDCTVVYTCLVLDFSIKPRYAGTLKSIVSHPLIHQVSSVHFVALSFTISHPETLSNFGRYLRPQDINRRQKRRVAMQKPKSENFYSIDSIDVIASKASTRPLVGLRAAQAEKTVREAKPLAVVAVAAVRSSGSERIEPLADVCSVFAVPTA